MRNTSRLMMSIATAALALPFSGLAQMSSATAGQPGAGQAMRMVPVDAVLKQALDSSKMQPGTTIHAKLTKTVKLNNGPELRRGTILTGTVEKDDTPTGGGSVLALRFTEAQTKHGGAIPVKVTIVGVAKLLNQSPNGTPPGDQTTSSWNDGTLRVDQISVESGVDLHSRIASNNSGTFVSGTKDHITLRNGTELQLAIAARNGAMGGTNVSANMGGGSQQ